MGTREMKDSGIEWIGMIPKDWEVAPVKFFFRGKKDIVRDRWTKYDRLALTLNGVIKRSKDDSDGLQPEKFDGYQILNRNELVFKLIDLQNTQTSRVGLSPYDGIVSPAYLVLSNDLENNRFYYYWFYSIYQRFIFNQLGDNGVRSSIGMDALLKFPVPCISISEQLVISTLLDAKCKDIDTLITLQEEMIAELQAYKQSVISETVTKGLNPNVTMKDSGVEWIGEIPQKWVLRKMKNLCLFINGDRSNNYPSPEDFTDSGIPFCGADSLNKINVDLKNVRYITIKKYDQMGGLKIRYGDILYTLRGSTIGKNAISLFENGTVASSLMGVRANDQLMNNKFLVFWLHSKFERYQREICINGSTAPNLSAANVGEFIISLPPLPEQQAIADYLDTKCAQIDELIALKQQKITELQDYKKSLIYEYVTGKKEVPANN